MLVGGVFCLGGCHFDVDDCDDVGVDSDFDDYEHRDKSSGAGGVRNPEPPGTEPTAGTANTPTPCDDERDCSAGYNCNFDRNECEAADAETCGELATESACTQRRDCVPIYGGTNCSCGADCECQGGEPGCICERFEYFVCRPAE